MVIWLEALVAQTTNVVIGGTVIDDSTHEWLVLDKKVNLYPMLRRFTAIGTGDDELSNQWVNQKVSSRDKYVTANIGPIRVISSEQVQALYDAMRRYDRMKNKTRARDSSTQGCFREALLYIPQNHVKFNVNN
ncbi:hypothetical protein C4D60_Mb06t07480 [Musa balbisiana]|uniref:Uncharacterized protein n=1 Tax=Musa balbisiana TaxID=52838 RepID=A0A4S8INS2_MUSBA|nr:hypothetical protein C4D60_Mb06t07480 [Musa balbisiana]